MRKGTVLYNNIKAGEICEHENHYTFQYSEAYLSSESPKPVSLTLPIQPEAFENVQLFSFFDGLIPEGWLLDVAEKNWKLNARDRMGLLLTCCKNTIGAVSVVREDDE
jgi:serine/threonine-protein kinase HipA